jgi:predicted Rossmann fold nucleotide-binding protein DprA/Smf involved in DNA uptake
MGYNPISIDALSERLAIPIDELSSRLLDLELQGWVVAVAGGYQRCQNTH